MPRTPNQKTARGYCFTINNFTTEDVTDIQKLDFKYLVFGFEVGANGTPHLQGYIHYKREKRFGTVSKELPRAHIEIRRGTIQQAIDYCKKDKDFIELGEIPEDAGEATKNLWKCILEHAKNGNYQWIENNHPRVWINLSAKLQSLRAPKTEILDGSMVHEWWVGPTGTGKSRTLWQLYPDHYQKDTNKWWCNYRDEQVVAVEEWSPKNECTGSQLKIWADRYPFSGQIKGGTLSRIRPLKIIVLSNYEIHDCFPDARDREPLLRRFAVLRFPEDIELCKKRHQNFLTTLPVKNEEHEDVPPAQSVEDDTASDAVTAPLTEDLDLSQMCMEPDIYDWYEQYSKTVERDFGN